MRIRTTLQLPIVLPGLLLIGSLLLFSTVWPGDAEAFFRQIQSWITVNFSWFYVVAVAIFVLVLIGIAMSDYGKIKLGPDDAEPEFSLLAWLAMLFAAGMGIGLMYFGVGEPLMHYLAPPTSSAQTASAAREAMQATFFHWGLHAWAIYGVVGLALAYFGFRYNLPLTIRSGLYPLLRDRINGPIGHAIDVFALICTIFGIATTLGYGVLQLSAGLGQLTGWHTNSLGFQLGLIAAVIALAGLSAATGLDRGVRILSELNLGLAIILLLFVLVCGPTIYLLGAFSENIGHYLSSLAELTFRTFTYEKSNEGNWFGGWTILYWAWWVSWAPFVGLFIARISRGRTVRQFVVGVLLVPALFNFLWMTVFGNTAIWLDGHTAAGALGTATSNVDGLLFRFFEFLPMSLVSSVLALVLIAIFFVTSADSGAFVVDNIATRGHTQSPVWQRLFWAVLLGLTAAVLLSAGGLKALQSMTLISALPFAFIMLLLCAGLLRGLAADRRHFSQPLSPATNFWNGQLWLHRLEQMLKQSRKEDVQQFISATVQPALQQVAAEMSARGLNAEVLGCEQDEVQLVVRQDGLRDFIYGVSICERRLPAFALRNASLPASGRESSWEPVTFFADGRTGYDVQYLTQTEMLADVLRQYERHLNLSQDAATHLFTSTPEHRH